MALQHVFLVQESIPVLFKPHVIISLGCVGFIVVLVIYQAAAAFLLIYMVIPNSIPFSLNIMDSETIVRVVVDVGICVV